MSDAILNTNEITLTGTAEAGNTVTIFDGTTQLGTATVNSSGAWAFTTGTLADGFHTFTASAADAAGNTSLASQPITDALNIVRHMTAPSTPSIASFSPDSGTVGDAITSADFLTLTGIAEANSVVAVFDGTMQLGTAMTNGSGAWNFATAQLSDGSHKFTATDTNSAGISSAVSSALNVTVDTVAPNAPVIASDAIVNTNEVMLTGTAEANSTVNVFEGTTQLGTATADGSGAWSYTTSPLSNGDHAFTATAIDAAGNTSLASQPIDPTISNIGVAAPTDATHGINGVIFARHDQRRGR